MADAQSPSSVRLPEGIPAGLLGGVGNAPVSGAGRFFVPGTYHVTIKAIKLFQSQQKNATWYFCIESVVTDSTVEEFGPGDEVSQLIDLTQKSALGNIRQFVEALLGCDLSKVENAEQQVLGLAGPDQPARGIAVRVTAIPTKTREGKDFTKVVWAALEDNAPALTARAAAPGAPAANGPVDADDIPF